MFLIQEQTILFVDEVLQKYGMEAHPLRCERKDKDKNKKEDTKVETEPKNEENKVPATTTENNKPEHPKEETQPVAPAPVVTEAPIPQTGPESALFSTLMVGVVVFLACLNINMLKSER